MPDNRSSVPDDQTATAHLTSSGYEVVLTDDLIDQLNERESMMLITDLSNFASWALDRGKDPEGRSGLDAGTVDNYLSRLDQIYRLCDELTLQITRSDATEFCKKIDDNEITKQQGGTYSESSKRKFVDTLRKYFAWRADVLGEQCWEPPVTFEEVAENSPDYLTKNERRQLRTAVLEFDTIPSYSDVSPSQRDKIYALLAQRIGKPKEKLTPDDWQEYNTSWEKPSLIWISLDAGLRPIEIGRAKPDWLRPDKQSLYVPPSDAAKGREHWECALRSKTAKIAKRWIEQRKYLEKYRDSDQLWLTRENNPWTSSSLNHLFDRLCVAAGIDQTNRKLSWYSIRHSVGQYMTESGGLHESKAQLRHQSIESTLQYHDPSIEQREETLEKIG